MTSGIVIISVILTVALVIVVASIALDHIRMPELDQLAFESSSSAPIEVALALKRAMRSEGWRPTSDTSHDFEKRFGDAIARLRYSSFNQYGPTLFELQITHTSGSAPEDTVLTIGRHDEFFSTHEEAGVTLHVAPSQVTGTLRHAGARLTGPALPFMLQCFDRAALEWIPRTEALTLTHCSMKGSVFSATFGARPKKPNTLGLGGYAPALEVVLRSYSLLAECFARATRWRGLEDEALLEGILISPAATPGLREQVRDRLLEDVPTEERPGWWASRIMNSAIGLSERGHAVQVFFERHAAHPEAHELTARVFESDATVLRLLILERAPSHVARQLRGPNALRWFSVIFDEQAGIDPQTLQKICESLDPMVLLDDDLSTRARSVLLVNLLRARDPRTLEAPLRELIRRADEEELVEMLTSLQMNRSEPVAQLVAHLASHPENVDKIHEYLAVLGAIRTFARDFPDAFARPGVDVFLCDCITHEDERVASMAPPLLELTGGEEVLKKLSALMNSPDELKIPRAAVGRAIQAIRQRLGKGVVEGALTLTAGHGGALTMASGEAGALTSIEAEDESA